jgi:hypothetical protein
MEKTSIYIRKINKFIFYLYAVVTLLIIILLNLHKISYGADATDSIMTIIFILIGFAVMFMQWLFSKTKRFVKNILLLILSSFMIFMIGYYFMENQFVILS